MYNLQIGEVKEKQIIGKALSKKVRAFSEPLKEDSSGQLLGKVNVRSVPVRVNKGCGNGYNEIVKNAPFNLGLIIGY